MRKEVNLTIFQVSPAGEDPRFQLLTNGKPLAMPADPADLMLAIDRELTATFPLTSPAVNPPAAKASADDGDRASQPAISSADVSPHTRATADGATGESAPVATPAEEPRSPGDGPEPII